MKRLLLLALLVPAVAGGCQKEEPIVHYEIEHPNRQKLRLLAAILPQGKTTWFLRLSGPEAVVAAQKENFDAFAASIRFDEAKDPPIEWTLPTGWKEVPAGDGVSTAAIRIDSKPATKVTVTSFEGKGGSELLNVNRWRGQLNLPPLEENELDRQVTRVKTKAGAMALVDLTGLGVYAPPAARPAGHPPMGAGPAPMGKAKAPAGKLPFSHVQPEGWKKQEPPAPLSVESYEIGSGEKKARVTLTPLGGGGGGIAANVVRWREQVGLPKAKEEDLLKELKAIDVIGKEATLVDFNNPASPKADNRIIALILPFDETTWFVKMTGPSDLLGREKANFESFVKSFKLTAR